MSKLVIELDLDEEGRTVMYETLCDDFGEQAVKQTLEDQLIQAITRMFDDRERLKRQARSSNGRT
jgi:hypothetical protein